jgi:DNA-binding SARP family transcriptional activator/tetratricopeptide (TPR) repeat protein
MHVRVRLLGPVEVLVDGDARPVPGLRRKAVLAALALQPGVVVSIDRLIDVVWGAETPVTGPAALQSHVSHLRRMLGRRDALIARPPGYLLDLGEPATDVQAAENLIQQGTEAADPGQRERLLRAAIELWRDRPLADLAELSWFDDWARRLDHLWLHARLALFETRLTVGQDLQLVPELEDLSHQHPFNEPIHKLLMLALYRAGRQADALAVYQRLRRSLDDELAITPSRPLQELETRILRQDPLLDHAGSSPRASTVPAQLPLAVGAFTGRVRELAILDFLLNNPNGVVVSAISGGAGIGKTTLAVHWAHQVTGRFPDGQLYVNLRGFDPAGSPMDPSEALRGFLDALGVPSERIPADLDGRVGLYRSQLAGKRVLVVLDNARDAEQVRPLLPGAPGCFALVTSRNQLTPLVVSEGAYPMSVDLLSTADAGDLLAQRIGPARTAAEPDAVAKIVDRCAGLPLALAITAARAAMQPEFPLAAIAAQLRADTARLDALDGGDAATNLRLAFASSYQALTAEAARLFRLLGAHPSPDVGGPAVTSLAGLPADRTAELLAELTRAHLLTEHTPGRYTCHDLLLAYAGEQAHPGDNRPAATRRLLEHYLHTAHAAANLLYPKREPVALAALQPGVIPERIEDRERASVWFTTERRTLMAVFQLAAAAGHDTYTWQLGSALRTFLTRQAHTPEHIGIQRTALLAARRAGDRTGLALTLHGLGHTYGRHGYLDVARTHYQQALDLYADGDDNPALHARIHTGLAEVAEKQGRAGDSLMHNQYAIELYEAAGNQILRANALNGLGWSHALLGNCPQAIAACTEALDRLRALGDREGAAHAWDSLGYAYRGLADYRQSAICYQQAIDIWRDLCERYWEAESLTGLGDTYQVAGDLAAARESWHRAVGILDQLNHPDARRLGAKYQVTASPPPALRPR